MVIRVRTLISSEPSDQQPRVHVRPAPKVDRAAAHKANTPSTQAYRKPREFRSQTGTGRGNMAGIGGIAPAESTNLSAFNTLSKLVSVLVAKAVSGARSSHLSERVLVVQAACHPLAGDVRHSQIVAASAAVRYGDVASNESGPAGNARSVPTPDAARAAG
jgi:hypothetical protein